MMPQQNVERPQTRAVFGVQVPIENYYLHRGHAWAVLEDTGQVRVGVDDFSQKILGAADDVKLPEVGKVYYQDHLCMALFRQGRKASFEAPVDGAIEAVNPQVRANPGLIHDDPYGSGWLFLVKPINLGRNLDNLFSGEANAAWIDEEARRLMNLMDTKAGITLPDGGTIIDDLYGHYPDLDWRRLVQEFFLQNLTRKGFLPAAMTTILPEDKKTCIWMEAGVIDYKICRDKDRNCEDCEFDKALRTPPACNLEVTES